MKRHLLLGAAALLLTVSPALAQQSLSDGDATATNAMTTETKLTAKAFVPMASSANLFEIDSSRLALTHTNNPQIRQFADTMIKDHTAAGEKLKTTVAATGMGDQMPTQVDPQMQGKLTALEGKDGAEFDAAYFDAQTEAHKQAIQLFSNCANSCDDTPAVKQFAATTLPTLQMHQVHLQGLASTMHPAMNSMNGGGTMMMKKN